MDDIAHFIRPETRLWYKERELAYRRGYLLRGVPGSGKTSLAFAIACHFKLRLHNLQLSGADIDDKILMSLFQHVSKPSFVLIEDIDCAGITRSGSKSVTLAGLLNAIDGAMSPDGIILLMTTNKIGEIDEAILRPGRVDLKLKFGNASTGQIKDLFTKFYSPDIQGVTKFANDFATRVPADMFTPARIQEYLILYPRNPQHAITNVEDWVQKASRNDRKALLDDESVLKYQDKRSRGSHEQ